ncbi:MAG: VOC family protein, partial [Anaerolineae bacterium]|nr:VOC family protein [Anaerolineae bacterium]
MSSLAMGAVHLNVANLETQIAFYRQNIGLQVLAQDDTHAVLGVGARDLLVLNAHPDWHPAPPRATGLYHFAILVPSRLELAKTFKNLIETRTQMQGFSDHLVSEALYLADPEGNGIEIYADRPRDQW